MPPAIIAPISTGLILWFFPIIRVDSTISSPSDLIFSHLAALLWIFTDVSLSFIISSTIITASKLSGIGSPVSTSS